MQASCKNRGQSVIEVIVAIGVFGIIAGGLASMAVGSFTGLMQGGEQTQAEALADEGLEAVKALYGDAWNQLTYSTTTVSLGDGKWIFGDEGATETIGKFTRTIALLEVCRDAAHQIAPCPSERVDVDTKEVRVTVSWSPRASITNTVTRAAYSTNWESRDWIQTDWRGGNGAYVWAEVDAFASSTGIDTDTSGEIKLGSGAAGSWENVGGVRVTHTSPDDFALGIASGAAVSGIGVLGEVSLMASSTAGTFISPVIVGESGVAHWGSISWAESVPLESTVSVSTRSGDTPFPDGTWSAWSSSYTNAAQSSIDSPNAKYLQYQVAFSRTSTSTESPQLTEVSIIYDAPTDEHVFSVGGVSTADVWAVASNATLLHYNGSDWSDTVVGGIAGAALRDVAVLSATEGWAVGGSGTVLAYNGNSWTPSADTGDEMWNALSMVSTSTGFAVGDAIGGDGVVAQYDGVSWTTLGVSGLAANLYDVDAVTATNVWAVGDSGKVVHYDGTAWSEFADLGDTAIRGIFMRSGGSGWAVGAEGKIYRYDGTAWSEYTDIGDETLYAVAFRSSNKGWIVGSGGVLFEWDGTTWVRGVAPVGQDLYAVQIVSGPHGWAVGASGSLLELSQGTTYQMSGTVISSAYDMGKATPLQGVSWESTIPTCDPECTVAVQLSAAADVEGAPGAWTDWSGAQGVGTYYTEGSGTLVPTALNGYRWVRYQATLMGDGNETPILEAVRINHK